MTSGAADAARRALALVDLTRLERPDEPEAIDALAAKAVTQAGPVAAICVYPEWIERVLGAGVPVAAVANFPLGADDPGLAARDAGQAVEAGAAEVDVVVPWQAFMVGKSDAIDRTVRAVRDAVGPGVGLKAILETGSLPGDMVREAGRRALDAGADFLKTSSGKVGPGASPEMVEALLEVVKEAGHGGVKASGGIRTAEQAASYIALADRVMGPGWATPERFRIGASALVDDLLARLPTGR
jgi:deoxyribose-phosphate aldolase